MATATATSHAHERRTHAARRCMPSKRHAILLQEVAALWRVPCLQVLTATFPEPADQRNICKSRGFEGGWGVTQWGTKVFRGGGRFGLPMNITLAPSLIRVCLCQPAAATHCMLQLKGQPAGHPQWASPKSTPKPARRARRNHSATACGTTHFKAAACANNCMTYAHPHNPPQHSTHAAASNAATPRAGPAQPSSSTACNATHRFAPPPPTGRRTCTNACKTKLTHNQRHLSQAAL